MGRPKGYRYKPVDEVKSERLNLRLTPQAKAGLEAMATAAGVTVSDLVEALGRGQLTQLQFYQSQQVKEG